MNQGRRGDVYKTVYDPVDWKPRINPNSSVLALGGRETRPA